MTRPGAAAVFAQKRRRTPPPTWTLPTFIEWVAPSKSRSALARLKRSRKAPAIFGVIDIGQLAADVESHRRVLGRAAAGRNRHRLEVRGLGEGVEAGHIVLPDAEERRADEHADVHLPGDRHEVIGLQVDDVLGMLEPVERRRDRARLVEEERVRNRTGDAGRVGRLELRVGDADAVTVGAVAAADIEHAAAVLHVLGGAGGGRFFVDVDTSSSARSSPRRADTGR